MDSISQDVKTYNVGHFARRTYYLVEFSGEQLQTSNWWQINCLFLPSIPTP